ncbi:reeler domain-containing protein [Phthorimaea operculella]|nr:reeler domain-containing protein [Phthorimaea operculella]
MGSMNCGQFLLVVCAALGTAHAQPGKCDQQPEGTDRPAQDGSKSPYYLKIATPTFFEGQTYVLELRTTDRSRPFKGFMITVEDPAVDNSTLVFNHQSVDVGTLKTLEDDMKTRYSEKCFNTVENKDISDKLNVTSVDVGTLKTLEDDMKTRYSEKCFNTVENKDISDKLNVTIHWVSPKEITSDHKIRIRAMVAENAEVWYAGGPLNITLEKNDQPPKDSLPYEFKRNCKLCSEARYEVLNTNA